MRILVSLMVIFSSLMFAGCTTSEPKPPVVTGEYFPSPNDPGITNFVWTATSKQQEAAGNVAYLRNSNGTGGATQNSHAAEGRSVTRAKVLTGVLGSASRVFAADKFASGTKSLASSSIEVARIRAEAMKDMPPPAPQTVIQNVVEGGDAAAFAESNQETTQSSSTGTGYVPWNQIEEEDESDQE